MVILQNIRFGIIQNKYMENPKTSSFTIIWELYSFWFEVSLKVKFFLKTFIMTTTLIWLFSITHILVKFRVSKFILDIVYLLYFKNTILHYLCEYSLYYCYALTLDLLLNVKYIIPHSKQDNSLLFWWIWYSKYYQIIFYLTLILWICCKEISF